MLIVFIAFWAFVTGAIGVWRQLNNKERWSVVKIGSYGLLTAIVTFVLLISIVILF